MKFYPFAEIKAAADCEKIAFEIGLKVADHRCAAAWRGGTNPLSVHLERDQWSDHGNGGKGGSVIDLVAQVKFAGDKQQAQEWLGAHLGLKHKKETIANPVGRAGTHYQKLLDDGYTEVCRYDYTDAEGKLLFHVIRLHHPDKAKQFLQQAANGKWRVKDIPQVLYNLPSIINSDWVCVVEGEKDVETLKAWGIPATCNPGGAGKWRDEFTAVLAGKDVVLLLDNDPAGRDHGAVVSGALAGKAKTIHILAISNLPKGDVTDWAEKEGGTPEALLALIKAIPNADVTPARPENEVELPKESTSNLDCARGVARVVGPEAVLFIRGGELVALSGASGATVFQPISPAAATSELERFVRFVTMDPKGKAHPRPLPENTARMILAAPEFSRRMPHIRHLCDYQQPCLDKAGKIVLPRPGYDADLQTYTNPGGPELEKFATVEDALNALWSILEGFCFDKPEREPALFKVSAMAYLLTAHCRQLIEPERCPTFYADGNRPGVGKDYLLGLPVVLTTGSLPEFHAPAKDADESRKRIFAVARSGARFYIISNCKGHLDDPALEASATSPMLSDRILGASTAIALPNTAIYGLSGNTLTYTEDLARRCVRIRLTYFGEEIETRRFRTTDLYGHVMQHRGRYLGALQAMVEHWQAKGSHDGSQPKASFVRWAAVVGGILEAAGILNPIGRDELTTAPTEEVQHLRRLLVIWNEQHGTVEVEASAARELATTNDLFGWWGDLNDRQGQIKFGKMLGRNEGRSFGGWKVQKRVAGQGHAYWRCMRAEP